MEKNCFQELYDVQRRIKNTRTLTAAIDSSIDPELDNFDKEISEFVFNLQQANLCIWAVIYRNKGSSITDHIQNIPENFCVSSDFDFFGKINETIKTSSQSIHELSNMSLGDSFCHIQSLFQYLWCDETVEEFIHFLFEASRSEFTNLVQGLLSHPLIWSYFSASLQPIFRKFLHLSIKELVEFTKQSLLDFSELIPEFFLRILRREENQAFIFWCVFLSKFASYPFLFGLCSFDFEIYHKDLIKQYFTELESFFSTPDAVKFMSSLLSARPAILYPSAKLFEEVTLKRGGRLLISQEDSSFFGKFVEFPDITKNTLFIQNPISPPPKPFNQIPKFIDVVTKILDEAKLILVDTQNTPKAALTQIVELGAPELSNELDDISNDLSKISMEELCDMINSKLSMEEETGKKRIKDTVAKYASQSSLVKMYTNAAKAIITNAKVLSFVENPTTPMDISTARAAATLSLYKSQTDCFAKVEEDKKVYEIMENDLVESTDPFIIKCKQNKDDLQFFADEINLIVKGDSPLEITERIITAMGWLSEYVFSCGEEEAGADCIVPLTILSICVARPTWLASVINVIENVVIPMHQENPIFPHTDFFFISTFSCAGGFIVSKANDNK